ncbi:hypothetical protein [Streptomyces sp. NPDC001292]|uniref:hypothetical protein n=1 Tax=Streptomyces sp. NPDC001292 TaxID=3364558 RepID=UPI0036CC6661
MAGLAECVSRALPVVRHPHQQPFSAAGYLDPGVPCLGVLEDVRDALPRAAVDESGEVGPERGAELDGRGDDEALPAQTFGEQFDRLRQTVLGQVRRIDVHHHRAQ